MRHEFMYETRHPPSAADLAQARLDVEALLAVAEAALAASAP
jgi:hypothetical protein